MEAEVPVAASERVAAFAVVVKPGGASDNDLAFGISLDPSGSAIVTGWSESAGEGYNIVTIKYCTAPATPGTISGDSVVCEGEAGVIYSVPASGGTSSYTWTLPP